MGTETLFKYRAGHGKDPKTALSVLQKVITSLGKLVASLAPIVAAIVVVYCCQMVAAIRFSAIFDINQAAILLNTQMTSSQFSAVTQILFFSFNIFIWSFTLRCVSIAKFYVARCVSFLFFISFGIVLRLKTE